MKYLHSRRQALGGYLPARVGKAAPLPAPPLSALAKYLEGSGGREQSTTMVFVQMLSQLLRDPNLGKHIVPIVADEARTFGMQALFRQVAIYSSVGQLYDPEDKAELLYYKEAKDGQILEEGITEAGAVASWIAAASSYSSHGVPMLPFYIFYSCFGFQRVGDLIWAAGDSRCRGFLLGATAGRTTLSGEGLQHEDGSSHLLFSTVPNCVAYDPCFGYELTVILQDGMRRMLEDQEDVFYYVTVMNENYAHPAIPAGAQDGILRGMYRLSASALPVEAEGKAGGGSPVQRRVQLLGAGTILREVIAAGELLERDWGVAADVWSVTSFTELRREGLDVERHNRLKADEQPLQSWVEQCLAPTCGPDCRGDRLHAGGAGHDPHLGTAALRDPWHRRLRPQRYPRRAAQLLRSRSISHYRRGAQVAGRRRDAGPQRRDAGDGKIRYRSIEAQPMGQMNSHE